MGDLFGTKMPERYYEDTISDLGIEIYVLEENLKKAEKLLEVIKNTNSHHQINEKIDNYKESNNG